MTQLTIQGFDVELENRLRNLARAQGLSLSEAALLLMRRGAELERPTPSADRVGHSLDQFIGVWSEAEEKEFRRSLEIFE